MHILIFKIVASVVILLAIVSCSSVSSPPENPNDGRYSITQDRAPSKPIELGSIPDVVPAPVVRTLAGNRSPYSVLGETYFVLPSEEGYSERGIASWYGEKFHGHKTSNGEVFDMYHVSAAHKSLPIPSFLKVTNLDNNRTIVVRVNDRGPFHGDRIIDLSYAAALKLGYAEIGTARVELEAIITEKLSNEYGLGQDSNLKRGAIKPSRSSKQYLQVAAFSNQLSAKKLSQKLKEMIISPVLVSSMKDSAGKVLYRVRIGPIDDPAELKKITERLVSADLGRPYPVQQ
tara:strand:- start:1321 stop:2184 length:864 start_codon:yes stop_codon:yes gene_type:complete